MAFNPSSFFIGAGTVLLTIAVGFGGGILMADAIVGSEDPRAQTKLEQRAAETGIVVPVEAKVAVTSPAKPAEVAAPAAEPVLARPSPPQLPVAVQDAHGSASDADVRRETRRQEQVRRSERRKVAERKRRKAQEQRALAERSRQAQIVERGPFGRERVAGAPGFGPFGLDD